MVKAIADIFQDAEGSPLLAAGHILMLRLFVALHLSLATCW